MQIYCFGDSIAYGAWDGKGGWVARTRAWLDNEHPKPEKYPHLIYNFGIPGHDSALVHERFIRQIKWTFDPDRGADQAVIFQVGTNDLRYMRAEGGYTQDLASFQRNITFILSECDILEIDHVAFHAIPPVDETNANTEWKRRTNHDVREYNETLRRLVEARGHALLDAPDFNLEHLGPDGLHPNDKGHELLSKTAREWLMKIL